MAADPPAAADDLPDSEKAALAAFASDVTRALLAEITPAERTAGKNNEIQRMDAVVLAAQEKESERLRASKVRNELATARGAATTQQTLDDGVVTKGLASRVQEAKVERTKLRKTIPGQPHFLGADQGNPTASLPPRELAVSLHAALMETFESDKVFVEYHTPLLATLKVRLVPGARHVIHCTAYPCSPRHPPTTMYIG